MADRNVRADQGAGGMDDDADKSLILNMDERLERALRLLAIAEQNGAASLEQAAREAIGAMTAAVDQIARFDEPRVRLHAAIGWLGAALEREGKSGPQFGET